MSKNVGGSMPGLRVIGGVDESGQLDEGPGCCCCCCLFGNTSNSQGQQPTITTPLNTERQPVSTQQHQQQQPNILGMKR